MKANTYKFLFRVAPGKTPFSAGTAAKASFDFHGRLKDEMYVAPCMYSWIRHWFDNEDDHLFAIERPSNLNPMMMCCGINSTYHYVYKTHKELLPKMEKAVIAKDFSEPDIQLMFKEHEKRVIQKFHRSLAQMKGGTYLATLHEWDQKHPNDGYPQLILNPKQLRNCKWEELEYIKQDIFRGTRSGLIYQIEYKLSKYGLKYHS